MQTFLPYPSFTQSAHVLDKKRGWKQVVETAQIINVLEGKKTAWINHPAVKMWVGYENALKLYFNDFLYVTQYKHNINTKYKTFDLEIVQDEKHPWMFSPKPEMPWWIGDVNFHRGMRARLIEKDRNFYLPLFPEDEGFNDGKYFWPVMEDKTFRII